jgi:hypothetical protein
MPVMSDPLYSVQIATDDELLANMQHYERVLEGLHCILNGTEPTNEIARGTRDLLTGRTSPERLMRYISEVTTDRDAHRTEIQRRA